MTLQDFERDDFIGFLPDYFNKNKFSVSYPLPQSPLIKEIQNFSKKQCHAKDVWPKIDVVNAWMVSAETATFMKIGGLGMIASELPEAYNKEFSNLGEKITIITPLYVGDTGKKHAEFDGKTYVGSENNKIDLTKLATISVPFVGKNNKVISNKVVIYRGKLGLSEYIFLENDKYFSINPNSKNPTSQDGCYVFNEHGINEVERFSFFSKAIYVMLKEICEYKIEKKIQKPNIIIANDWHSGALAGLTKYLTTAKAYTGEMSLFLTEQIREIPIIHIAHHLGYQGWDYDNTSKILNSLYDNSSSMVFKNAKPIKNTNPRMQNTLIVHDCYNQASSNFHLADRIVTVSKNYLEEVSKELKFGLDFRDILKIRKDHRSFFGIVNGYEKSLISPNQEKIKNINEYFQMTNFASYDEANLAQKFENKKEFVKLLSRISTDVDYQKKVLPRIELYKFSDLSKIKEIQNIPILSATSRLAEQKGYDIAAKAILNVAKNFDKDFKYFPIFILGGAGDVIYYDILKKLKDDVTKINKTAGERIFVFHGYCDQFAYSIQLASDFYLMPCRFEPCGLTQMEAMAKGAIPITTSTGGLVDTIDDGIDGFRTEVFFVDRRRVFGNNLSAKRLKNNENAYTETLQKALNVFYKDKSLIEKIRTSAMKKDFSWSVENGAIQRYYQLFHTGHI